jgi:transcriptional regulator with XRE-family HTH domain
VLGALTFALQPLPLLNPRQPVMPHEIDTDKLAAAVLDKRKVLDLGVRAAAADIGGVSPSTLSRVEQGNLPDLDTFFRLCRWLSLSPSYFARVPATESEPERHLPGDLIVQLRADRTLDERTRDALVTMIRAAYAAARAGTIHDETISE